MDGCPDKGKQLVQVQEEKIELLEKVRFARNMDRIIAPNQTPEGRAANRRVEFVITAQ